MKWYLLFLTITKYSEKPRKKTDWLSTHATKLFVHFIDSNLNDLKRSRWEEGEERGQDASKTGDWLAKSFSLASRFIQEAHHGRPT